MDKTLILCYYCCNMSKIKKPTKKLVLIALVLLLIVSGVSYALLKRSNNNAQPSTEPPGSQEKLNLDPPTAEDAQRVDENKQRIVERQEQEANQSPTAGKKTVTPVITYAGQYGQAVEVGGYVNGVFEDNGTCTTTFTLNSQTVKKSVQAVKNNNSVDCPVMAGDASEFPPKGKWIATLSYTSPTASGASAPREIEIR